MLRNLFVTYVITAVALFVGTLLPWASVMGITVNGTDADDGGLVIVLALVALVAALLARGGKINIARVLGFIASFFALLIAIYEIHHITSHTNSNLPGVHASSGVGLWIIILGAVVGLVGMFLPTRIVSRHHI